MLERLNKAGFRSVRTDTLPASPGSRNVRRFQILVDRLGMVKLVRVVEGPATPQVNARLLSLITAGGVLPPPPSSLVAFGEALGVNITLHSNTPPERPVQT